MLGVYENFPENVHKTATFAISTSNKKLQQLLIQLLKEVNNKTFNLKEITVPTLPNCSVIFEFGIAEANNFNYLDDEETNKMLRIVQGRPLEIMDFYCALKYYKMQNSRKTPLKFDYYMIRLTFDKNLVRMQIFHERGPRYASPEDIINFVVNEITKMSSKKIIKTLGSS
jgi:hypothetical protein